jgi:fructose-1,6-bisphosphatase/inositol monophosphatase family enzyme
MTPIEQLSVPQPQEPKTYTALLHRVPDAVNFAHLEAETSDLAKTPEGRFALTYLLAARNLLRPVLREQTGISADLIQPIGGHEYNPERTIDDVGTAVALTLADQTTDIPEFWMRTEESSMWTHIAGLTDGTPDQGKRFAVIDPVDMTSSITKGDRVQTTGIAIYDRQGELYAAGIMSLVDDGFVFVEQVNGKISVYPNTGDTQDDHTESHEPIRIGTLTRRMYALRNLPLFQHDGMWTMDSTSGYAVLALHDNDLDTIIDPFKGNPWYEVAIWVRVAQALGYPVTDIKGNPIDISASMRRVIEKHEGDSYRIPFVISRTPEIHKKVLEMLQKEKKPQT